MPVILIVDDQPANVFALERLLEDKERIVLTAASGPEALQIALNNSIDLIMLDVQMPEMDGFEVAQILKSSKRTRDIPIIFATAVSKERRFVLKGYEEGAVDYLYKPLDPDIVKAKVSTLLKLQMQKKELFEKNIALEKSALLINNSADIIGIIDAETLKIEEINSAFTSIFNTSPNDAKGELLTTFLSPESTDLLHHLKKEKKELLSFETSIHYNDTTSIWLQWKVVVKEGKWFVNARDITGIKEAHEQIREINKDLERRVEEKTREVLENEKQYRLVLEKRAEELQASNIELERFAFVASHDLQEPLRMVSSFLTLLEVEAKGQLKEGVKEYIRFALDGTERMRKLIQALLSYSRLDTAKEAVTEVDCNKLINTLRRIFEPTLQEIKAKLLVSPLPIVTAVESQLQQLFQNLVGNALKYHNHDDARVEVGCYDERNMWKFYVKDNGIGIEQKYYEKIFIIFQRLHDKTEYSGTGIGLAICKKIVEKHGGAIWVESKAGEGSTFYFTIPKSSQL